MTAMLYLPRWPPQYGRRKGCMVETNVKVDNSLSRKSFLTNPASMGSSQDAATIVFFLTGHYPETLAVKLENLKRINVLKQFY